MKPMKLILTILAFTFTACSPINADSDKEQTEVKKTINVSTDKEATDQALVYLQEGAIRVFITKPWSDDPKNKWEVEATFKH